MRIYQNAVEAFRETERDLFEMGRRVRSDSVQDMNVRGDPDYETIELFGYGFMLARLEQPDLEAGIEYLNGNVEWARAEFEDRVNPQLINPGYVYLINRWATELWGKFVRDDAFAYTYNERLREQLPVVTEELRKRPGTRHAIITVYDRHQDMGNWGGKDRVPCSMHYQFALRDGALHAIYTMRSCDFVTHFCHDVYFAARLCEHIANRVGAEVGNLTCFYGSLHAFRKDLAGRGIF